MFPFESKSGAFKSAKDFARIVPPWGYLLWSRPEDVCGMDVEQSRVCKGFDRVLGELPVSCCDQVVEILHDNAVLVGYWSRACHDMRLEWVI